MGMSLLVVCMYIIDKRARNAFKLPRSNNNKLFFYIFFEGQLIVSLLFIFDTRNIVLSWCLHLYTSCPYE